MCSKNKQDDMKTSRCLSRMLSGECGLTTMMTFFPKKCMQASSSDKRPCNEIAGPLEAAEGPFAQNNHPESWRLILLHANLHSGRDVVDAAHVGEDHGRLQVHKGIHFHCACTLNTEKLEHM